MTLPPAPPIEKLRHIVARLRAPDGCPWDREQTAASLIPGMIEEVYEVVDAIEKNDDANLREELGDLLLQVVMQSQITSEDGRFTFDDLTQDVSEKLIRRHPHVFADAEVQNSEEVLRQWDDIKLREKHGSAASSSLLDGVPLSYPALLRAKKLQNKAAKIGFDWERPQLVLDKVYEELGEVRSALASGSSTDVGEEIGDLLFTVVNLARKCGNDPELTMHRACDKFVERFQQMEAMAVADDHDLKASSMADLELLWGRAKAFLRM